MGLSDLALLWMIARVSDLTALEFDTDFLASSTWPCPLCTEYLSDRNYPVSRLLPSVRQLFPAQPRVELHTMISGPRDAATYAINAKLHWSVLERSRSFGDKAEIYKPVNVPDDLQKDLVTIPTQKELDLLRATRRSETPCKQRCDNCKWPNETSIYLHRL